METIVKINDTSHVVVHDNNEESLWKKSWRINVSGRFSYSCNY